GVRAAVTVVPRLLSDLGDRAAQRIAGLKLLDLSAHENQSLARCRFCQRGEWGLLDGREDNGVGKLDERYLAELYRAVRASPQGYGWRRPTWTRELLVETLARRTGVRIHVATMSRALVLIRARRGRPRPTVGCPWAPAAKTRRLNALRRLLD